MAKTAVSRQPPNFITTPLALVLLFFLFLAFEFIFTSLEYFALAWLAGLAFIVVVLAVAVSSGAVSLEYKFIRTNERPKPPPQKFMMQLPANTVQVDPSWQDAPAIDAEFKEQPQLEHKPTEPANFANYRQTARSVSSG
jgi:hypothetical protein